jgi:cell wall-associated NlpC family hydrolase
MVALAGIAGTTFAATVTHPSKTSTASTTTTTTAPSTGAAIVKKAVSQEGIAYCEGGGGINGPTVGNASSTCAPGVVGYDCMTLAQYAVYQVTRITVPDPPASLPGQGTFIPPNGDNTSALEPGDVVFFGGTPDSYKHSGIYAGDNEVLDALAPGDFVTEHSFATIYSDYGNVFVGAVRYSTSNPPSLSVTTSTLPDSSTGTAYSTTLAASGGNPPYTWKMVPKSGKLPRGLALDRRTGAISGTPKATGKFSFTVEALDTKTKTHPPTQNTATAALSITVSS